MLSLNTCTDHGDWRFYIYPFVSIYTRVNKDKSIKMGFLNSTKSILNGIIILKEKGQVVRKNSVQRYIDVPECCLRNIPTYFLFLCILQDYCRSVQQNLALHVLLCTETKRKKMISLQTGGFECTEKQSINLLINKPFADISLFHKLF